MGIFTKKKTAEPKDYFELESFIIENDTLIIQKRVGNYYKSTCLRVNNNKVSAELGLRKLNSNIYLVVKSLRKELALSEGDKAILVFDNGKGLVGLFQNAPKNSGEKNRKGAIYIENYILLDEDFENSILNHKITGIQYRSEKLSSPLSLPISPLIDKPTLHQENFKKLFITLKEKSS